MTTKVANPTIRRMHHFAIGTKDMAKTKTFYTELLGLKHSQTWKEEFPDTKSGPRHYMHCFFELGDGSALAFFQFAKGERQDPERLPREVFDHHIALDVETKEEMLAIKKRYEDAKQPCSLIDHGYCWSLYTRDPNGMLVEIAVNPPGSEKIFERKAQTAGKELEEWLAGDYAVNNYERSYEKSDLPISSMEEVVEVVIAPQHA